MSKQCIWGLHSTYSGSATVFSHLIMITFRSFNADFELSGLKVIQDCITGLLHNLIVALDAVISI